MYLKLLSIPLLIVLPFLIASCTSTQPTPQSKAPQNNTSPTPSLDTADALGMAEMDVRPVPRYTPEPKFPFELLKARVVGIVRVQFIVRKDGTTTDIRIVQSSDPRLNDPVITALEKWTFHPGKKAGTPVNCLMQVPIKFDLSD